MAGCHVIMIDIQGPRRRLHLITVDHDELRHHAHVLMTHQVASGYTYGVSGSWYGGNVIATP
jgi:hypothetical protein